MILFVKTRSRTLLAGAEVKEDENSLLLEADRVK